MSSTGGGENDPARQGPCLADTEPALSRWAARRREHAQCAPRQASYPTGTHALIIVPQEHMPYCPTGTDTFLSHRNTYLFVPQEHIPSCPTGTHAFLSHRNACLAHGCCVPTTYQRWICRAQHMPNARRAHGCCMTIASLKHLNLVLAHA